MFNYLTDDHFVEYVLEMEKIPFLIRGSLGCSADFNFRSVPEIRITGPTYRVSAIRENTKDPNDKGQIHIQELFEEVVFQGEIDLPEKTKVGVFQALNALERWADLLCLAIGNPKIVVEVQKPVNIVMASPYDFDLPSFASWSRLTGSFLKLEANEQKKLSGALWWYRKACATVYYSLFDSYTAYWNCLEIMFTNGPSKIAKQMKAEIGKAKFIEGEQGKQIVHQCFEVEPKVDQLYQIRNDINHGNIRENSASDYRRVFFRGMLLQNIVMELLHRKLGYPISLGMSVNELAEKLKAESSQPSKPLSQK